MASDQNKKYTIRIIMANNPLIKGKLFSLYMEFDMSSLFLFSTASSVLKKKAI